MDLVSLIPIGHVVSSRAEPVDDGWDGENASIELSDRFTADALLGLDEFSHVEVVYQFHRVPEADEVPGSRHPRAVLIGRGWASLRSAGGFGRTGSV